MAFYSSQTCQNYFKALPRCYPCVLQVETLGDAVYMVAGGVPDRRADHTQHVAGLALEFVDNAKYLKDPLSGNSLTVRIGTGNRH